jgi:hypothetical protein
LSQEHFFPAGAVREPPISESSYQIKCHNERPDTNPLQSPLKNYIPLSIFFERGENFSGISVPLLYKARFLQMEDAHETFFTRDFLK